MFFMLYFGFTINKIVMIEKENFAKWMGNRYTLGSIRVYPKKIDDISEDLKSKSMLIIDSLYQIKNPIELQTIYQAWSVVPEFIKSNENSHKQASSAFKRYIDFRLYEQKLGLNTLEETVTILTPSESKVASEEESYLFALEEHLQDFLIKNLATIKNHKLKLYEKGGRLGKEYPTEVGPIDILTIDEHGNFYVFETKLSKGIDKALGQILRYMGWVKKNLSNDKEVFGIIVANKMDLKIKSI